MNDMKEIPPDEFTGEVEMSERPVLVNFCKGGSESSKLFATRIEELEEEFDGEVKFVKVDVNMNQELAKQFDIRATPVLLLFDEGEKVKRIVGSVPIKHIQEELEKLLR